MFTIWTLCMNWHILHYVHIVQILNTTHIVHIIHLVHIIHVMHIQYWCPCLTYCLYQKYTKVFLPGVSLFIATIAGFFIPWPSCWPTVNHNHYRASGYRAPQSTLDAGSRMSWQRQVLSYPLPLSIVSVAHPRISARQWLAEGLSCPWFLSTTQGKTSLSKPGWYRRSATSGCSRHVCVCSGCPGRAGRWSTMSTNSLCKLNSTWSRSEFDFGPK